MWKDKLSKNKKCFQPAPKHFYKNFRYSKIADAKYMAEIGFQNSLDPDAIKVCEH
jgi:hypothetical protein